MNEPDYAAMTYQQLKCYIVKHREDKAAFSAFLARRQQQNRQTIANVKDVDCNQKLQTAIAQKLKNSTST
jgi:hypothetical protein